jgi:hypothetical protein
MTNPPYRIICTLYKHCTLSSARLSIARNSVGCVKRAELKLRIVNVAESVQIIKNRSHPNRPRNTPSVQNVDWCVSWSLRCLGRLLGSVFAVVQFVGLSQCDHCTHPTTTEDFSTYHGRRVDYRWTKQSIFVFQASPSVLSGVGTGIVAGIKKISNRQQTMSACWSSMQEKTVDRLVLIRRIKNFPGISTFVSFASFC